MLVIRLQRTGRKGHAMFRVVVQDSRRTPTSGKVVARLGSYDPHQKTLTLDKEKTQFYLDNGAQPSERAVGLLKEDGIKMPNWINVAAQKQRAVRNADKRRSTRPDEPVEEVKEEETAEVEEPAAPETPKEEEKPAEETKEPEAEEKPSEESKEEAKEESKADSEEKA
jgi:small subunit ribosomal protein S16